MKPNFDKYHDGLVPVIIQDAFTNKVLMLGFMNEEAYNKTLQEGKVTFYSRSKQSLWTKGETSGNYLLKQEILLDCDNDTILIKVLPTGPICHTGNDTCFGESNTEQFLYTLETIIDQRKDIDPKNSYIASLFAKGKNKIAQKVGEEAVEVVIEAVQNENDEAFLNEAADLFFHFLILLKSKNKSLKDVLSILQKRHHKRNKK